MPVLWTSKDERFFISDSRDLLKFDDIQTFLHSVPTCRWVTLSIWNELVRNSSAVFGVYLSEGQESKQVGCARLISDKSRWTWLDHMFILPPYRGLGLGKALISVINSSSEFQTRRQAVNCGGSNELYSLLTRHGGFASLYSPESKDISFMYKWINPSNDHEEEPASSIPTGVDGDGAAQGLAWVPHAALANYYASTSKDLLDVEAIQSYLTNTYWAKGITLEGVIAEVKISACLGLYYQEPGAKPKQIGFARWVTDSITFAYMSHVFILDEHAGKGLGKWLVELCMRMDVAQPARPAKDSEGNIIPAHKKLCTLRTRDAEGLYERYAGFKVLEEGEGEEDGLHILMRTTEKR